MSRVSILGLLLILLLAIDVALGAGDSRHKGTGEVIRQKRQYLGYPYGMGYPYSYGYGYNPYMMYRPYPMYGMGMGMGMPYYRPYGFWGK